MKIPHIMITLCLFLAAPCQSDSVYLMGLTHHFYKTGLNGENYAAIYHHENYVGGAYLNSYDHWSGLLGLNFKFNETIGVASVVISGYSSDEVHLPCFKKLCVAPIPYLEFHPIEPLSMITIMTPEFMSLFVGFEF